MPLGVCGGWGGCGAGAADIGASGCGNDVGDIGDASDDIDAGIEIGEGVSGVVGSPKAGGTGGGIGADSGAGPAASLGKLTGGSTWCCCGGIKCYLGIIEIIMLEIMDSCDKNSG